MAFGFGYNIPQVMSGGPCVARKSKRSCRATAIWMSSNWQPEGAIRIFEIQRQDQRHFVRTKFQISRSFFLFFSIPALGNKEQYCCRLHDKYSNSTEYSTSSPKARFPKKKKQKQNRKTIHKFLEKKSPIPRRPANFFFIPLSNLGSHSLLTNLFPFNRKIIIYSFKYLFCRDFEH